MNCLDALDREKSKLNKRETDWDVIKENGILKHVRIDRYCFKEEVIGDAAMFILPCHLDTSTFVTDKFVERFKEKKLTGLSFLPYWSSERGHLCEENYFGYRPIYPDVKPIDF
jgi:hypothetical protein